MKKRGVGKPALPAVPRNCRRNRVSSLIRHGLCRGNRDASLIMALIGAAPTSDAPASLSNRRALRQWISTMKAHLLGSPAERRRRRTSSRAVFSILARSRRARKPLRIFEGGDAISLCCGAVFGEDAPGLPRSFPQAQKLDHRKAHTRPQWLQAGPVRFKQSGSHASTALTVAFRGESARRAASPNSAPAPRSASSFSPCPPASIVTRTRPERIRQHRPAGSPCPTMTEPAWTARRSSRAASERTVRRRVAQRELPAL